MTVKIWSSETCKLVQTLFGHTDAVMSVCFSPDGKYIASASRDASVKIWARENGKLLRTISGHTNVVMSVCFSPDGKYIASASRDKTVKVWESENGKLLHTMFGHTGGVCCVCFSPDGKYIASASSDKTVKIWLWKNNTLVHTILAHIDSVHSVCFSPDGKYIASASSDKTVKIWDSKTHKLLHNNQDHTDAVCCVCFSPDGKYIASASYDGTVKIWSSKNGSIIFTLKEHTSFVYSVCFMNGTQAISDTPEPSILWFNDVQNTDVSAVGGKNANLCEMMRIGLRVPDGFAVTAFAYERFIEETHLSARINDIIKKTITNHNDANLCEAASKYIRKLIEITPMPKDIEISIKQAYEELSKRLNLRDAFVAVISSVTTKDLPNASFTALQDTRLNVKGSNELIKMVVNSWSSLFTPNAIFYREEKKVAHDKVFMSVGVQKMVNSRAGGIMFTLNPVTGNNNEIIIEGSFGLGEAVVSGAVNPDYFVIDKSTMTIKERRIAKKTVKYVRDPVSGETVHLDVSPEQQKEVCMSDKELLALANVACEIERHYGKPMDIEWAFDQDLPYPDNLFLVQARPETVWSKTINLHEATGEEIREQIKSGLSGFSHKNACIFAWLCAVRALPFLGAKGNFDYWKQTKKGDKRQEHLLAILKATDTAVYTVAYFNVADAANAAHVAATDVIYAASNAAYAASNAAYAASNAACANAADAANAAHVAATDAAVYAFWAVSSANADYVKFCSILLDDLENIKTGKHNFQKGKNIYGLVWDNFQKALRDLDCEYWADWYAKIFANDFRLDDDDREEIEIRLNAPVEIEEQGAAEVARYVLNSREQKIVAVNLSIESAIDKEFRQQIERQLSGFSRENIRFFAWLCAVRALPFLNIDKLAYYWENTQNVENTRQKQLFLVLKLLDTTYKGIPEYTDYAFYTSDYTTRAVTRAYTSAYATDTDYAIDRAAAAADYAVKAAKHLINLKTIMFDDLENIKTGKHNFQHDISMYRDVWGNFQRALRDLGCEYWSEWYTKVFANGFILDESDLEEIKVRLSVPDEISEKGASDVARYVMELKGNKKFSEQVKRRLSGFSHEDICFFAWLCAVRALPFLSADGNFNFWIINDDDKRQRYLFSVLRALDAAVFVSANTGANTYAAIAADDTDIVNYDTAYAARANAYTVYAAHDAARAAYNAVDAAAHAAAHADDAAGYATHAPHYVTTITHIVNTKQEIDLRQILFEDLENIKTGKQNFKNDTSMYGELWNNFQKALHDLGCEYWSEWYAKVFAKGFILDDKDKEEIRIRLNAPDEIMAQGATAVACYIRERKKQETFDFALVEKMVSLLLDKNVAKAKEQYEELCKNDTYNSILEELTFVKDYFNNSELEQDTLIKLAMWRKFSQHNFNQLITTEKTAEKQITMEPEPIHTYLPNEISTQKTVLPKNKSKHTKTENIQLKGSKLEKASALLFAELFRPAENGVTPIEKLRIQNAGNQFGFDIELVYKSDQDNVTCLIECKNYKDPIKLKDVSDKIHQLKKRRETSSFDCAIIISPNAKPSPDLNEMIAYWNKDPHKKFHVEMWDPTSDVNDFFGLLPDKYDEICKTRKEAEQHPKDWPTETRKKIISKFRNRLRPCTNLPQEWHEYVYGSSINWTLPTDSFSPDQYSKYVDLKASNEDGPQGLALDYVLNWLKGDTQEPLIILGEFGTGKSFFTYCLAQKLVEEYKNKGSNDGWIPLRFSLQEYGNNDTVKAKTFWEECVSTTVKGGANLASFREVISKNKVLIILDGFDEMSREMHPDIIGRNSDKLVEFYDFFSNYAYRKNIKFLVTSRKDFFNDNKKRSKLLSNFDEPQLLELELFSKNQVIESAETDEEKEKLREMSFCYDPIGLARRPLFFDWIKICLKEHPEKLALTEVSIYRDIINYVFTKKIDGLMSKNSDSVDKNKIKNNMQAILKRIAVYMYKTNATSASLTGFFNNEADRQAAIFLWELPEPTDKDTGDAENRILHRSLLVRIKTLGEDTKNVNFCHRSMGEYFVAKAVCDMLNNKEDNCDFLNKCDLNKEIVFFASQLIVDTKEKYDTDGIKKKLLELLNKTRQKDEQQYARLGRNAVNILYKTFGELPGTDYKNMVLDGANLYGAILDGKIFSHTSLKNANLFNVSFINSVFTRSNLTGALFGETFKVVSLVKYDDKTVYALYDDKSLWKWAISAKTSTPTQIILPKSDGERLKFMVTPSDKIVMLEKENNKKHFVFYNKVNNRLDKEEDTEKESVFEKKWSFEINDTINIIEFSNLRQSVVYSQETDSASNNQWNYLEHQIFDEKSNNSQTVSPASICYVFGDEKSVTYMEGTLKIAIGDYYVKQEIPDVSCVSAYELDKDHNYLVSVGCKDGKVYLINLKRSGAKWDLSFYKLLKQYNADINNIVFINDDTIAVSDVVGNIYINQLDKNYESENHCEPLSIKIHCKGMEIDGLESEKERTKLEKIIEEQNKTP